MVVPTANLVALSAANATVDILKTDALATGPKESRRTGAGLYRRRNRTPICRPPSMFGIHFGDHVPTNYRAGGSKRSVRLIRELIHRGVMLEFDSEALVHL